ncbi:MAG: hypothetical protein AMS22_11635 [Thiotrichales bacterium SG8_50]|nr:MAG: hypothetical protein AMS22_11635 [Thiotrichales bacterium SG8_50]
MKSTRLSAKQLLGRLDFSAVLLGVSILIALALRLHGIHWGLPNADHPLYSYHPDEVLHLTAARVLVEGVMIPKHFQYGGTFYYTILNAIFFFAGLFGDALGQVNRIAATLLLGRYFLVGIAVLTIVLAYAVGTQLFSRPTGAVAAMLLAVMPAHIASAQHLRPDEISAFLALLVVYTAVRILRADEPLGVRPLVYSGLVVGVASALRLPLAVFGIMPLVAYLLRDGWSEPRWIFSAATWRVCLVLALCAAGGYALTSPHSLVHPRMFLAGLQVTWRYETNPFPDAVEMGPGLYQYGWTMLRQALGTPLYALALAGIVVAVWRRTREQQLLLAGIIPYFVIATFASWVVVRYLLPLLPLLALLSAKVVTDAFEYAGTRRWVVSALVASALAWTVMGDLAFVQLEFRRNNQDVAKDWIAAEIPPGATIGTFRQYREDVYFNPVIPPGFTHVVLPLVAGADPAEWLDQERPQYLVLHEFIYKNMERLGERHPQQHVYALLQALQTGKYELVKEFKQPVAILGVDFSSNFSSHDYSVVNPGIRIYRLR